MERITARSNPLCLHFRRLAASRAYREESGEYLCDSPKLLAEAVKWGAEPRAVLCTEPAALPPLPSAVRVVQVPPGLMESLSPMETPQGVLFSCPIPAAPLPERLAGRHYLVLDGVQDPGNVGTILRTADAFDADGLFLLPGCADLYNPKTVRAAMGVLCRREIWRCDAQTLAGLLRKSGIPLYGAALRADTVDARQADYTRAAVAIGSEGRGLSGEVLALCDRTVRIPMSSRCESLNAAAAAAVLLWEMYR